MILDNFRSNFTSRMETLRSRDLRTDVSQAVAVKVDETMRAITGGLTLPELRSILSGGEPTEKPNPRYRLHTKSFWFHIRPRYYQRASTWFTHTFRLGWLSAFFFVVEVITGLILMIFYAPSPGTAYGDILNIMSNVPFGRFMRDLHRLGAEAMVIVVALHMFRVYLTGSFKSPRQFTWLTGALLLLITLFLSFSGYLLPWDQLAYWAVTIGTSMAEAAPLFGNQLNLLLRGAPDIGAGGLLRFYLLHVIFLPLLAIVFISIHYYKVAREHGISLPAVVEEGEMDPDQRKKAIERVDLLPDLLTHEILLVCLATFVLVVMVATVFHAPLEHHSDPLRTPFHTTAPWYFLWLQGLLKLGDKTLMGIIVPTVIFGLLFAVPYIDQAWDALLKRKPSRLGRNRRLSIFLGLLFAIGLAILTQMGQPTFGIESPAAQEVTHEFMPEEGVGPIRALPFDDLLVGSHDTTAFTLPTNPTPFESLFAQFKTRIERDPRLPNGQGVIVIADWQDGLKKITMRIFWDEPTRTERQEYETTVYVHRDSGYAGE
jgi:ubiquinol-cytochrome c reductase cytochrome b subunit